MKKEKKHDIGIISFNMNTYMSNFGAALHSYAFQKYLSKKGVDNVIIDYSRTNFFLILLKLFIKNPFLSLLKISAIIYKQLIFSRFFRKNCIITKNKYNQKTISQLDSVKQFCCETDITWCTFMGKYDRAFMCDYPNMKDKDNFAYSVDFGSKKITEEQAVNLKKYANNFKKISIRNPFRLEEFKSIIDRDDVIVTIDPVFLLQKEEYYPIIKKIRKRKPFIFIYNCKENHNGMVKIAKEYAKKNNLEIVIVNCCETKSKYYITSIPTPIGIEEFLGYINDCEMFFTNSYHGICFAVILEKQFWAFQRFANNDKICTILNLFNLNDRLIESYNDIKNLRIDYEIVKILKDDLLTTSKNFIDDAININKK